MKFREYNDFDLWDEEHIIEATVQEIHETLGSDGRWPYGTAFVREDGARFVLQVECKLVPASNEEWENETGGDTPTEWVVEIECNRDDAQRIDDVFNGSVLTYVIQHHPGGVILRLYEDTDGNRFTTHVEVQDFVTDTLEHADDPPTAYQIANILANG